MACYAPLFAHYDHTQWGAADLIWFDKRNLVKTPNYYVQQLFSRNTGDVYLKNTVTVQKTETIPTIAGAVGIATWNTMIELQSASVNGTKLDPSSWKATSGDFGMQGDLYIQSSNAEPAVSFANRKFDGETVTYTVRARKTGGSEGFMLVFGATDEQNYYWWNIGGWDNTQHAIEQIRGDMKTQLVERRGSIRDNTWYTMKVELSPGRIRCWLNDELIHDYEMAPPAVSVSSTLDKSANQVIVKLVNPTEEAVETKIYLDGVDRVQASAQVKTVAGPGNARNSRQNPDAVKTVTEAMTVGKEFEHTIPAMSVQFIRVKLQ
jgi:alpha-L-arabinofuranosidase